MSINGAQELIDLRKRFNDGGAKMYPGAAHPGDCWVFDIVLGIDPRSVVLKPITKKEYHVYLLKADGTKTRRPNGTGPFVITRKFTPRQQQDLREWWPLMSDFIKGN